LALALTKRSRIMANMWSETIRHEPRGTLVRGRRLLTRSLPVAVVGALFLVILSWVPAHATFVSSKCVVRGPRQGATVRVCVRVNVLWGLDGPVVWGYGAMDHRGANEPNVRMRIEALHIRVYRPPNGPQIDHRTSRGAVGTDYIKATTDGGFNAFCGDGYKAVMTYGIRWPDGSLTRKTNFYTPGGTVRWTLPECGSSSALEGSVGEDDLEPEEEEEELALEEEDEERPVEEAP
jgi:hypothetical protein